MNLLVIDTSHPQGSATLLSRGHSSTIRLAGSSHLVELGKALASLFAQSRVPPGELDRAAIVVGPGSFTGLRVGMAYLKGLYAARPFEVVTITSLELLAMGAAEQGKAVASMIDARKDEVYASLYEVVPGPDRHGPRASPEGRDSAGRQAAPRLREIIAPCVLSPERLIASMPRVPTVFAGSGALRYREIIISAFGENGYLASQERHQPDTERLCRMAMDLTKLSHEQVVNLEPFYIRSESVTLKPLKRISAYERD